MTDGLIKIVNTQYVLRKFHKTVTIIMKRSIFLTSFLSLTSRASQVCFQNVGACDLGCFIDTYPYGEYESRPLKRLPRSPEEVNVHFYFDNKYVNHVYLDPNDPNSWKYSGFNPEAETKVIIHGWIDMGDVKWARDMSDKLIEADPYTNVIRVDWVDGSRQIDYAQSSTDTQIVGGMTSCLLKQIYSTFDKIEYLSEKVHCIGHSLGGQTCGYVGRNVQRENNGIKINRITGLDPAEPYFGYGTLPEVCLDETDADFVDVIHTDVLHFKEAIISLHPQGFGIWEPVGHVDFFPNNGTGHPGCDQSFLSTMTGLDGLMDSARDFVACNHMRSIKFFLESLNLDKNLEQVCPFTSYACDYASILAGLCLKCDTEPCVEMGINADKMRNQLKNGKKNSLYLVTGGEELDNHYCSHSYILSIALGPNADRVKGSLYLNLYGTNGQSTAQTEIAHKNSLGPRMYFSNSAAFETELESVDYVKFMWTLEERDLRKQYMDVEYIQVQVGDDQKSLRFCNNENKLKEGTRYKFERC